MDKFRLIAEYLFQHFFELIIFIALIFILSLRGFQLISENIMLNLILFGLAILLIKWIVLGYFNFMLSVRGGENFMRDNRAIHFLNFDAQKFILIALAIVGVIFLGVNKVLNNETIATLLGGLIGSLLTMKGSYQDLKFDKEEIDNLNKSVSSNQLDNK